MTPSPTSGLPPGVTPTKDTWSEFWDETYQCYYYSNVVTEEVKWEKPIKYDHIIPDEEHPHSDVDEGEGEGEGEANDIFGDSSESDDSSDNESEKIVFRGDADSQEADLDETDEEVRNRLFIANNKPTNILTTLVHSRLRVTPSFTLS